MDIYTGNLYICCLTGMHLRQEGITPGDRRRVKDANNFGQGHKSRLWSNLGCSGQNATIFSHKGIF